MTGRLEGLARCRGGSRIPRRRGRQPSERGVLTYDFAKFSQKLHEMRKFWAIGGHVPGAPPLDPLLRWVWVVGNW